MKYSQLIHHIQIDVSGLANFFILLQFTVIVDHNNLFTSRDFNN